MKVFWGFALSSTAERETSENRETPSTHRRKWKWEWQLFLACTWSRIASCRRGPTFEQAQASAARFVEGLEAQYRQKLNPLTVWRAYVEC